MSRREFVTSQENWANTYLGELDSMGWKFITTQQGGINSKFIAYQDEQTPKLINNWAESKDPVEMSIVAVMPNTNLGDMPIRALGYAITSLALTESLRHRGVNIDRLRIFSPCEINAFANGGDSQQQTQNAVKFASLVKDFKFNYMPSLKSVDVELDTGIPVSNSNLGLLSERARRVAEEQSEIAENLNRVAKRYNVNHNQYEIDEKLLPLFYLLSHPEAWGYSQEETFFRLNGERRINFMPQSELRYLSAMTKIRNIWAPAEGKEISTTLSSKHRTAPYYRAASANEPTLADIQAEGIDVFAQRLRSKSGNPTVAEIIGSLNQLKTHIENSVVERKKLGLASSASLNDVINSHT